MPLVLAERMGRWRQTDWMRLRDDEQAEGRRGATGQRVEAEEDEATLVDVVDHPPNTLQFFCACLWQAMPTTLTPTLSTTNSPSTSANSTPRPLSPPLLTLNGSPIAPPSSSAYPPLSPARKRRSSNAKMSASQKQLNPSYQRPRPAAGRSTSSTSSSSGHASRTKNVAIPNPILHPLAFASWIKWRISVWLLGHLALGMLTDVEIFLLCEYASPSPMPLPPTRRSSFALTSSRTQSSSPASSPASSSTRSSSTCPTTSIPSWEGPHTTSSELRERAPEEAPSRPP